MLNGTTRKTCQENFTFGKRHKGGYWLTFKGYIMKDEDMIILEKGSE